ncbi:MAG: WxcM-like domain-containing protein [Candidatus Cloacimonetes bacterium]|nr:WxcM-like domain-containing protein [Candidatus Cloacimonadota bacterium]
MYTIDDCKIIELPKLIDNRGSLSFIEEKRHIPFEIKRIYYIYDLTGEDRGYHAHKKLQQLYIPIHGHFDVLLNDGKSQKIIKLDKPNFGLYICPWIWRELKNFSNNAICLVLASEIYKEDDYIRDYNQFVHNKE